MLIRENIHISMLYKAFQYPKLFYHVHGFFRASSISLYGGTSARDTNDPIRKAELNVGAKMLQYLAQFLSD
jgi:hypothetical protein